MAMLPNVRMRTQTVKDFMESLVTSSSSNSAETSPASADSENTHVYVAEPCNEDIVVHAPKVSHANFSNRVKNDSSRRVENEGIWHEFVRCCDGSSEVYASRLGKCLLVIWCLTIIGGVFAEFLDSKGIDVSNWLYLLPNSRVISVFFSLGFIGAYLLYFIGRAFHEFIYDVLRESKKRNHKKCI